MKIILGSSSKWRQDIFRKAGYDFTTLSPDIDEKAIRFEDPIKLTLAIAHAKADALAPRIKEPALLITSDQVVVCHHEIFEKPCSKAEAKKFIDCYNQHSAQTVTAIVVTNTNTQKRVDGTDIVNIEFFQMPDEFIEQHTENPAIYTCAGGFQIEMNDQLNPYIKSFDGAIDSIKGLPLQLTKKLLTLAQEN